MAATDDACNLKQLKQAKQSKYVSSCTVKGQVLLIIIALKHMLKFVYSHNKSGSTVYIHTCIQLKTRYVPKCTSTYETKSVS